MVKQLYDRKQLKGTSFLKEFEDALYMFDNLDPYGMDKREAQQNCVIFKTSKLLRGKCMIKLSIYSSNIKRKRMEKAVEITNGN